MGFRKLHDFNLALLGKQAWRLVTQAESLVGKVFKARYYPNGNFLTAELGSNPSFVWRSIIAAQDLLKSGLACRVGNGSTIDIEDAPWLPCESDPYVHTKHEALRGNKVSALMTGNHGSWDIDLVKDIFIERDVNLILSVPVQAMDNDSWFWRKDKFGQYTVKSAYASIRESVTGNHTSSNSGFWNKIWNLKIPLKVKHFMWRAICDCLPTKTQLRSKKVEVDSRCPVCNLAEETVVHTLITCPMSVLCWQQLNYTHDEHTNTNVKDWIIGMT